jgi:hypothetical protein
MTTLYRIKDDRGNTHTTEDAERAGHLSRAGLRVTAATVDR